MIARFYGEKEQSLFEHIQQTASFCSQFSAEMGLEAVGMLCGLLHDMGKYQPKFQTYLKEAQEKESYGISDTYAKSGIDHGVYGGKYLWEQHPEAKGISQLTRDLICTVVTYHHGGLPDSLNQKQQIPMLQRFQKITATEAESVYALYFAEHSKTQLDTLFEKSCTEMKVFFQKLPKLHKSFCCGLLLKTIYSCLVDADRLDSYLFTLETPPKQENAESPFFRYAERLEEKQKAFAPSSSGNQRMDALNQKRSQISDACKAFAACPDGIYTLTVPTGGGKTFASLRFALQHSIQDEKHPKKKIFYIMPYTTIVEQNAQAVRDFIGCKEDLLEYHSNLAEENKNVGFQLISERFDAPIIFTTMVQFLNAFYAKGNDNIRRLHQFQNSVIVFDEIQALPLKCIGLFYGTLEYLRDCLHTTSILCTATQPDFDFIEKTQNIQLNGEIIPHVTQLYQDLKRMEIIDRTTETMTCAETADFIITLKQKHPSVLLVLNKIQTAEKIFTYLKEKKERVILLTSHLCPAHRKDLIQHMKEDLQNNKELICLSTQLIEAGVDLSFSTVVRSLCGMDSIAQAAGRGNRNAEAEMGQAYIIQIKEEDVSMLPEIARGQKYTRDVLYEYRKESHRFGFDLLSPKAIQCYYTPYFTDEKNKSMMNYPIHGTSDTITGLLKASKARQVKYDKPYPLAFDFQFASAADAFHVIDTVTHSVIVPWKESVAAEAMLLLRDVPLSEKYAALKSLQGSTVNLYDTLFRQLEKAGAFLPTEMDGIYLLDYGFYDSEKGISLEKKEQTTIF